jgi:GNAT superfamily N-acetyltransferase
MTLDDESLAHLGHLNNIYFSREAAAWGKGGGYVLERDGVLMVASASPFPVLCNGVWRVDERVPASAVVDAADQWFAEHERGYSVSVRDLDVDRDLRAEVEARGLVDVLGAPEMVCRERLPDEPTPSGAELRWVHDDAGIRDFVEVNTAAYGSLGMPADVLPDIIVPGPRFLEPHVQSVVAYLDDEPVAAAQTILSHGIAGVYWVGTVERARGTGLGATVTRAVTNRAFDLGARANTLQASRMGEPIYLRMGYETLYRYRTYTRFEPPR